MNQAIFVGDIVEANGNTWKQNNLAIQHDIPLGSLVEIDYGDCFEPNEDSKKGIRLFVVEHSRDCDGTPLYDLSFDLNAGKEYDDLQAKIDNKDFEDSMDEILTKALFWKARGALLCGYSSDSLQVIKKA